MRILLFILGILHSSSLLAMEVACESPEINFKSADAVFIGSVIKKTIVDESNIDSFCWTQESGSRCGAKVVSIEMERSLKGKFQKSVSVSAGDACYCVDPYLEEGQKYIIFAKKTDDNGKYSSMNACATQPFSEHYLKKLLNEEKER